MKEYIHSVKYYETDKMGITHHSNYVRWMEEARIDFLDQIGYSYKRLEEEGIVSPVIAIDCKYKATTTFDDKISITVAVKEFKGVKLIIGYEMKKENGDTVCTAESIHCFLDNNGKPLRLKISHPDFYNRLVELDAEWGHDV